MKESIPGLRSKKERHIRKLYWRASRKAVAAGFPVKNSLLWRGPPDPDEQQMARIADRCIALTREQRDWLIGKRTGRPSPMSKTKGVVYFVRAAGKVKIGFSTNIDGRLPQLQTASSELLELIGMIRCTADREAHIHRTFNRYRLHGEWFRIEGDLAAFLDCKFSGRRTGQRTPAHAPIATI